MQADLQLLDCEDERDIAWHVAAGGPLLVAIKGRNRTLTHRWRDGNRGRSMNTIPRISGKDIQAATLSAKHVVEIHEALTDFLTAGLTLPEIDSFVGEKLRSLKCKSAFYKYKIPGQSPFPSQSCLSVNDCVVHGTHTMAQAPLAAGDLVSIDIGVIHHGWIGDAAWTWGIESVTEENMKLMEAGRASLAAGVAAMQPNRPLMDFAKAVQGVAEGDFGFHLIQRTWWTRVRQNASCTTLYFKRCPFTSFRVARRLVQL